MIRSIITLVLFVCVVCQAQDEEETFLETCKAWGDPHIERFPLKQGEKPAEVMCKDVGSVRLLKNKHINVDIVVSAEPYVITEFKLEILGNDDNELCVVNEKRFLLPDGPCGPGVQITRKDDLLIVVYAEHKITATIQRFGWTKHCSSFGYSLTISQSALLVTESVGLCVTPCDPKSGTTVHRTKRADADQDIIQKSAERICEISISKLLPEFKISALNKMNMETKNVYSACIADLRLSGETMFAKEGVSALNIHLALKYLPTDSDTAKILINANALFKQTRALIGSALTEFLKNSTAPPSPSKDDFTLLFDENEAGSISCLQTYSGKIKIVSATYYSLSSRCSMDAAPRLKEICVHSPRLCKFKASNTDFRKNPCGNELKQVKVHYKCV